MKTHINHLLVSLTMLLCLLASTPASADPAALRLGLAADIDAPKVEAIPSAEDVTPFIGKSLKERSLQQQSWENIPLPLPSALPEFREQRRFNLTVVTDSASGQPLKAVIEPGTPDSTLILPDRPKRKSAEQQLQKHGERYLGFADPKANLVSALDAVLRCGIGSPYAAARIEAVPVRWRYKGRTARDVWIVTLYGIPPLPAHGPYADKANLHQRRHVRNVIDATTGTCVFATNIPHP